MTREEIYTKWIAALRSGDYKQTTGGLRVIKPSAVFDEGFCCLGVLCDVVDPTKWRALPEGCRGCYIDYEGISGDDTYIPGELATQLGLTKDIQLQLAALNDSGHNMPFTQIADHIETLIKEKVL